MDRELDSQMRTSTATAGGTVAAVGAILLWCFSGVCYAAGSRAIGAMPYLSLTSAAGVITICILRLLRGDSLVGLVRVPRPVVVAGFFGVTVYSIMLVEALSRAAPADLGHVMLLNYLWPIWILLLSLVMLDTDARPAMAILGALVGLAGLVVARGMGGFAHRPASWLPHGLALAGGFLWALYSVLLRRWRIPAERGGSTFHFVVCAVLAGVIAAMQGQWKSLASMDARAAMWVVFGGIGPVGLGYYWWEIGIKRGSVRLIALLAYFIPIGSAVLIGLFFREAMSLWLLAGAAMIATGAWIGSRGERPRK
ncbi:MAG: DMT family transporter [Tepidisphaerales bacterium]